MPRANLTTVARGRAIQSSAAQSTSASSASSARALKKRAPREPPQVKGLRRKAERDEVKDMYTSLTAPKTYRGGFTRPSQYRSANWQEGGPYLEQGRGYASPDPTAYAPTTVYLLEGRHPTVYGPGRVDTYVKAVGQCREPSLPDVLKNVNSPKASQNALQAMEDARWPWDKPRRPKQVRWYEAGENPQSLRAQAVEAAVARQEPQQSSVSHHANSGRVSSELLLPRVPTGSAAHARGFHSSAAALSDDPDSFESRKNIPGSTWSRPPRPSQDAQDDVVPTYYVERKKQRDHISQRKEEEGGLMAELNAGILSEGLAAKTRVREEKIPVEVRLPDGTIAHPSGFEPPTPETDFHPVAAKVPTEDDPLVATVKQTWDDRDFTVAAAPPIIPDPEKEQEWLKRVAASGSGVLTAINEINAENVVNASATPTTTESRSKIKTVVPPFYIERKKQRDDIAERKEEEGGLMAELNAGILSEDLAAQTREREEKIPVEVFLADGTIAHPSGFVPPTPETEFHPVAAKPPDSPKLPWTEIDSVKPVPTPAATGGPAKKPGDARGYHTSAVVRANEVSSPLSAPVLDALVRRGMTTATPEDVLARRARYLATLEREPFWRPLLTVTLGTRPLASALKKATRARARGTPYFATIEPAERKDFASYNARLRTMQLDRIQQVTREAALRLGGAYGGLIGLRTSAGGRGRAVGGEGLADALPEDVRRIKIGVGEWYPFAEEVKERFLDDAERGGYGEFIEVFGVDEWGNRTDGKAWAGEKSEKEAAVELDID
ncbi:hypothetical protein C2E23DRAFT_940761 [Lenzites betulinus]|nr:hypothetical protein C2E23DRAFT_940761 [Lenzites betulinus]